MSGDQDWHEKVCRHMADGRGWQVREARSLRPGQGAGTGSRARQTKQTNKNVDIQSFIVLFSRCMQSRLIKVFTGFTRHN